MSESGPDPSFVQRHDDLSPLGFSERTWTSQRFCGSPHSSADLARISPLLPIPRVCPGAPQYEIHGQLRRSIHAYLALAIKAASPTIPTGPCHICWRPYTTSTAAWACAPQRLRLCRAAVVRPVLWRQRAALYASGRRGVQHAMPERADVRWRLAQQHLCNRQFAAITGRRHASRLGRPWMLELDLVVSGP